MVDSRPATVYLSWDEKNLYMAVRVWMPQNYKPRIRGGRAMEWGSHLRPGL